MSSILEALKKLEREKASHRDGLIDISAEILKGGDPSPFPPRIKLKRFGIPLWTGGGTLLACLLAAVAVYYLYPIAGSSIAEFPSTARVPANVSHSGEPASTVQNTLQPPTADTPVFRPSSPSVTAQHLPEPIMPTLANAFQSRSSSAEMSSQNTQPAKISDPAGLPAENQIPRLTLFGIAYDQERKNALAVINNQPLVEGEWILGAKVEKIFPDKVRLSWRGKTIELVMGKQSR